MSFDQSYYPTLPSLRQLTQRAFAIRREHGDGQMCRWCALRALTDIEESTANAPLQRLCETLAYAMFPEVPKPQPDVGPVEVFA